MSQRTISQVRQWVAERLAEETAADSSQPESTRDAAYGSIETLNALEAWLDGDDEA